MREILPVVSFIVDLLLKQESSPLIAIEMGRKAFPNNTIKKASDFIKKHITPTDLLYARLAFSPYLFSGDCKRMRTTLKGMSIRIPYIINTDKCFNGCINYEKQSGRCILLGAKVLKEGENIHRKDIFFAIDNLCERGRISKEEAIDCKQLEEQIYLKVLMQAVKKAHIPQKECRQAQTYLKDDNRLLDSVSVFHNEEEAKVWVRDQLGNVKSVSEIKPKILKKFSTDDAERIIRHSIFGMDAIHADILDCKESKYEFCQGCSLIEGIKCGDCPEASDIGCEKLGLKFSYATGPQVLDKLEEPEENRRIRELFAGTKMAVEINPLIDKTPLDVTIPNPGRDMEVQVNTDEKPVISDEEMRKMFNGIEMKVEVSEKQSFKNIDLEDFGRQEGLDLSDF